MFSNNIQQLGKTNTNFRKVLYTGQYSQIVAMALQVDEDIGEETHPAIDQLFLVADGKGEAIAGGESREISQNDLVFVPAGTKHNIRNAGSGPLRLITIYSPPAHADGTVHATKNDALKESETAQPSRS